MFPTWILSIREVASSLISHPLKDMFTQNYTFGYDTLMDIKKVN